MFNENKNLILAIGLSVLVLIGWNYFYGVPQMERQRQAQQATAQQQAANSASQAPSAAPKEGQPSLPQAGTLPSSPAAPISESPICRT